MEPTVSLWLSLHVRCGLQSFPTRTQCLTPTAQLFPSISCQQRKEEEKGVSPVKVNSPILNKKLSVTKALNALWFVSAGGHSCTTNYSDNQGCRLTEPELTKQEVSTLLNEESPVSNHLHGNTDSQQPPSMLGAVTQQSFCWDHETRWFHCRHHLTLS